jgi:hypothetical protein
VIIAAPWLSTAELATMGAEFPEVVFVVVSHSSVGFLSADPHAIRLLRETVELQLANHHIFVGGNSEKFVDWATEAWGVNAVWLPNLYDTAEAFPRLDGGWSGGTLRLGLFGANRPLKLCRTRHSLSNAGLRIMPHHEEAQCHSRRDGATLRSWIAA